jgi:hypothetical protein
MQQVLGRRLPPAEIRRRIVEHFSLEALVRATEQQLSALCTRTTIGSVESRQGTLVS